MLKAKGEEAMTVRIALEMKRQLEVRGSEEGWQPGACGCERWTSLRYKG